MVIGTRFEDEDEDENDERFENPGKLELFFVPANLMAWHA